MSFRNPTQLAIGMTGTFSGRTYRVVGRVVMGVVDDEVIYHWNEFDLESDTGETVTLVYEQTDHGGEWRWFTMFEPQYPMTAADAASKRVGDKLDFGEGPFRVTLIDHSRIYFIEGKAPEGEEVGDTATYFNAEAGKEMIVVSWTGEEVEFYRGTTLARGTVEAAFNIAEPVTSSFIASGDRDDSSGSSIARVLGLAVAVIIALFFGVRSCGMRSRALAVKIFPAPAAPFAVGASGSLDGKNYRVTGHDIVEISEVGLRFQRHEFQLSDDDSNGALLVCGLKPNPKDWCLLAPLPAGVPLTPQQAGNIGLGRTVNLGGVAAPVTVLFCSRAYRGADSPSPGVNLGGTDYGFVVQTNSTVLIARWNQTAIHFEYGRLLPTQVVMSAFAPGK